jgi:hypothetical protein
MQKLKAHWYIFKLHQFESYKNPIKSFFIYLKPYFAITNVHILLSFKFAYLKIMKIHIKHAILQQYCNKVKEHVTLLLIIEIDDRLKFSIPRFYFCLCLKKGIKIYNSLILPCIHMCSQIVD